MAFVNCPPNRLILYHKNLRNSKSSPKPKLIKASLSSHSTPTQFKSFKNDSQSTSTSQNISENSHISVNALEELKQIIPFKEIQSIRKPGQYLGNEFGAIRKPWHSVKVRFCLAYPDLYSIGMSSTGHVVLYSCINEFSDLLCDRSYLPGLDMQAALNKYNKSLFAVESKKPLRDFDIVGMSLMYELGATNCIKMMQLSNIPYTWWERDAVAQKFRDGPPLIFAGGLTVTANPEPYCDLFDFMSIGDGEEMLPEVGQCVVRALEEDPDISRENLLLRLAQEVSGVYVPRFYAPNSHGAVRPIRDDVPTKIQKRNSLPQPWRATSLVPLTDPVHDRLTVEVRRGCTRGCRFCLPGMVQRPARDVSPEDVIRTVKNGVKETGYNEFSLLSLSCSDWLSLPAVGIQLKNELKEEGEAISLSLGSQRVDRFDKDIVNVVGGLRRAGLTFAPEAGTQRMRDVINKGLTNEDLARGVKLAYDNGYHQVKLYFMINLPSETDEDVLGIAETIKWLQRICRTKGRRRIAINVTVSTFTPKSWTPFQWHSTTTGEIKRKQQMIKKALRGQRDVKLNMTDPMLSSMEDFIGRGDRRHGRVIIRAHELGAGMDAWWETMKGAYDAWCQAIRESGLEWKYRRSEDGEWNIAETIPEDIRGPRGWYDVIREGGLDRKTLLPKSISDDEKASMMSPLDRPLPWDHIDTGLSKGWLRDELMKALSETLTPDCAFNECSSCGVCGTELGNNVTIPPPEIPAYQGVYRPKTEVKQRIRVTMEKKGALALASHLDFSRMVDRLVRKKSIPVAFNAGFHPHPRIINAAALPFGATASGELVDFFLHTELPVEELQTRLNSGLPDGIRAISSESISPKDPPISMTMRSADYLIAIEANCDDMINWEDVINSVLDAESLVVEKVSKKGTKTPRDLRKMLKNLRLATADEAQCILAHVGVLSWPNNAAVLFGNLELTNEGALSPDGVLQMLKMTKSEYSFELIHCHRLKLHLQSG